MAIMVVEGPTVAKPSAPVVVVEPVMVEKVVVVWQLRHTNVAA